MADRRYVPRQTDVADRRHEWLELTTQGRAVYEDLLSYAGRYDEKLVSILTPDETRVLRSALIKLAKI